MLVGEPLRVELRLEVGVEHALERVLEGAVVDLEDGVLRGQVNRVVASKRVGEAGAREAFDRGVEIEHPHRDAAALGLDHLALDRLAPPSGFQLIVIVPAPGK